MDVHILGRLQNLPEDLNKIFVERKMLKIMISYLLI